MLSVSNTTLSAVIASFLVRRFESEEGVAGNCALVLKKVNRKRAKNDIRRFSVNSSGFGCGVNIAEIPLLPAQGGETQD